MNLAGPFLETLRAQGNAVAIREPGDHATTYAELVSQIAAFQHHLRQRGFQSGDAVVVQVPNGNAFAVATVAALSLGGVAVLCEPGLGDKIYLNRLNAASPKWVFVHPIIRWVNRIPGARALLRRRESHVPPLMPQAPGLNEIVVSNTFFSRLATNTPSQAAVENVDMRHDAIIIFTGGTTSMPKGVRLSHGALSHYLDNIAGIARKFDINTFLADTPQQVLYGLNLGKEVYVTKGRTRRRAAYVRSLIEQGRIDAYFGSPFLWMEMLEQAGADRERLPSSLKAVLLGGAPVTPEFITTLGEWLDASTTVLAIYGLTEAGPVAIASADEKIAWNQRGDFVGQLTPGTTAEADGGGVGEIIIHSDALFTGYLGQSERPANEGLRTGDLGRIVQTENGEALVLLGRAKDMIIRAGVNVYPSTIESELRAIQSNGGRLLREAALIGLWDKTKQDEAIVLCYQPMNGVHVSEHSLKSEVESITGADARPDFFLLVDPIPVTGRQNKVDKEALRDLASRRFCLARKP